MPQPLPAALPTVCFYSGRKFTIYGGGKGTMHRRKYSVQQAVLYATQSWLADCYAVVGGTCIKWNVHRVERASGGTCIRLNEYQVALFGR